MNEWHGAQCVGLVTSSGRPKPNRCSRTGTVEHDGEWYCHQHSPDAVAQRALAREVEHEVEIDHWRQREARAQREAACLNAFESPDGRTIPTEAITPGLYWEMHDALNRQVAKEQLSSLQPKRGV